MAKKKKKHLGRKNKTGGEAKKKGLVPRIGSQASKASVAEAHDHKRGNIGPSGQGTHRGRERRMKQTAGAKR